MLHAQGFPCKVPSAILSTQGSSSQFSTNKMRTAAELLFSPHIVVFPTYCLLYGKSVPVTSFSRCWQEGWAVQQQQELSGLWAVTDCKNQAKSNLLLAPGVKAGTKLHWGNACIFPPRFISSALVSMSFCFLLEIRSLNAQLLSYRSAPICSAFPPWEKNVSVPAASIFSEPPLRRLLVVTDIA